MNIINKYSKVIIAAFAVLAFASCDDFLDTLPDNRAELNTLEKIERLLVSAYPETESEWFSEYMSDNTDDTGESNPYTNRYIEQVFNWEDVTETDNSSPENYWEDLNLRIESANTALEAIEATGCKTSTERAVRAEALLCRAYANFMLVNLFAMHYNKKDSTSLGINYNREPETVLTPKYERATVHENYADIQADIEKALPDVSDEYYSAPKYHFNQAAAYAFATRFYLFSEQWDKAIEAANVVLGSTPANMLRDYKYMSTMTQDFDAIGQHYIDASLNCNLLLTTAYSSVGVAFGPWYTYKRFAHAEHLGEKETISPLAALWGGSYSTYYLQIHRYSGTNLNIWTKWSISRLFEYTDPVAQTGFSHTVCVAFSADEVLLSRAEAYIMKKEYDRAAEDMTTYIRNVSRTASKLTITPDYIKTFMDSQSYAYDDAEKIQSATKKHLHPKFEIDQEGSIQESMLQAVLLMRRYETLHEGKRWFDIKRYGIEIPRRTLDASGKPAKVTDWLTVDDPRRAIQIPEKVVEAGYTPNPRNKK